MLDLSRLGMLIAIQDAGSISAAARYLRYTAAAVSQQVAKLERESGLALVNRHARGVTLTPAGEVLAGAGREVTLRLAAALDDARQLAGLQAGKLRIATFQSASASLLPKILAPLYQRFPRLGLEFVQVAREQAQRMLRAHQVDAALIHEHPQVPGDLDQPGLVSELLHADTLQLVAAASHPAASWQEPVDLARLHGQALIAGRVEDDDRRVLDAVFHHLGAEPIQVAEVGEYFIAAAMTSSGMAVTLMPEMAVPAGYSLAVKRLRQKLERHVYLATREDDDSTAVAAFRQTAFSVMGQPQTLR